MDTDDLSEEAYLIIITARTINEFLCVQLGALSNKYKDEEGYLKGALQLIRKIRKDPEWFQDMWVLEEPINPGDLLQVEEQIRKVQNIPYEQRRLPEY